VHYTPLPLPVLRRPPPGGGTLGRLKCLAPTAKSPGRRIKIMPLNEDISVGNYKPRRERGGAGSGLFDDIFASAPRHLRNKALSSLVYTPHLQRK